ncbi:2-oxo acid dehydrogenase subunit E2 [Spiroplasma endosymbiont of Crioceris asparagi]|uniref:2-oxo acid dehydrogenase subunit E2 n=1 Tax=Spiroplasma endosymbiont of Crioceris asparagi TaxID=3066286 RepID=UPI0030D5D6E4
MSDNKSKLFEKDLRNNKSRFRDLVEKRRSDFLAQEDYEEFVEKKVDSQDFLDDDGKPKTLRNVIDKRMQDFKEGTLELDDDSTKYSKQLETSNSSDPQTDTIISKISKKPKTDRTYAEKKIMSFYDREEADRILNDARVNNSNINNRKRIYESQNGGTKEIIEEIGGVQIPIHFLRESKTIDPRTGRVVNIKFKDTPDGRDDFIKWLKLKNIFHLYKDKLSDIKIEKQQQPDEQQIRMPSPISTIRFKKEEIHEIEESELPEKNFVEAPSAIDELAQLRREVQELRTQVLENTNDFNDIKEDVVDDLFSLEDEDFSESKSNRLIKKIDTKIPDVVVEEVNISSIFKIKNEMKEIGNNKFVFSTMAFVIKAISLALNKYKIFNSNFNSNYGTEIFEEQNIGLVIDYEGNTLVPVIKSVENLTIKNIAKDISKITAEIRGEKHIYPEEPTITVANFGHLNAIASLKIQPNNSAAISLGKVVRKEIHDKNKNRILNVATLKISLTYDRRICEQNDAKAFLKLVKNFLEKPQLLTLS